MFKIEEFEHCPEQLKADTKECGTTPQAGTDRIGKADGGVRFQVYIFRLQVRD
jgi:hypothetical protein